MIFPSQINSHSPRQPQLADSDSVTPVIAQGDYSFQALFTAALDAMLIVDDEGCYLDANPAACQLLGLERQDLLGCCPSDFAASGFNFAPAWQQFLEQGQGRGEFRLIQPDGELREIEYAAKANFIPHYHLLNLRDVTASKQTAARLHTLENLLNQTIAAPPLNHPDSLEAMQKTDEERYRLQKIARHIPGVIYQFTLHTDGGMNFPYASEGLREIYGIAPEAVREDATKVFENVHPDDLPRVNQSILESAQQLTPWHCEYRVCHPDGRLLWLVGHSTPQRQPDGSTTWYGYIRDITAQKEVEQALRENHVRLQLALEAANIGTWDWNPQTNEVAFSRQWKTMLGYEEHEIGNSLAEWESRVHPEDMQAIYRYIGQHIEGKTPVYQNEHRIQCKNGSYKWILDRGQVIERDEEGKPVRFIGIHHDITERKQAEAQLKEISERLSLSLKSAAIGCWEWNITENSLIWDDRMYEIYGVTKESDTRLVYDIWATGLHPDDREASESFSRQVMLGQAEYDTEFRVVHPDGSIHFIQAFGIVMRHEEGSPHKMIGVNFDITERKQADAQLQSLLNRTQLLNQISTEIRNSLDLDTILQNAVNAIFTELKVDSCSFGWYRSELDPPRWEIVKERRHQDLPSWLGLFGIDGFQPLLETILRQQVYRLDMNTTAPDEEVKAFCQHMGIAMYLGIPIHTIGGQIGAFDLGRMAGDRPWQDDEIQLLQSIATQVAIAIQQAQLYQESKAKSQELQHAYRELQETQVQLIQAEKMSSLGQLVAGVAHEINNPVSFIYGNLNHATEYAHNLLKLIQLYQDCYPDPPEAIADFSEDIDLDFLAKDFPKIITSMQNGASRIRDIVKSLRTFSRLDEADVKAVDLPENLDSTLVILQNRLNGRAGNPQINVVKQYGDLPLIECYSGLLNQVFMNLLVNAIEAIEERQTREAADYSGVITITTAIEPNWVSISIQDNGIGMSPEVQAKIFNPFFTTKPIGQGTGMGLSISYQIVSQNHAGELSCTSTPGVGTEFKIKLPWR